jgi:hypothetical protein
MQITPVKIRAEGIKIKWNLSRRMGTIYDSDDACRTCSFDNFIHRENKHGRRSDMTEKDHPCMWSDR